MLTGFLFENINGNLQSGNKKRDERVETFGQTLNDAFKQFQKLWDDYKELFEKCKAFESNSTTAEKDITIPEKESREIVSKEQKSHGDLVPTTSIGEKKESPKPENDQIFQIFSQDFCTQGLEESFIVNQSKQELQEAQIATPERSKSPIIGSKKDRIRVSRSSPMNSPNLSQKSVVILNDFDKERNSEMEKRSISNPLLNSDCVSIPKTSASNSVQISSSVSEIIHPTSSSSGQKKNKKTWGISTIHNVNTDIIVGTNKKLKQSKIFMKREKITDLSTCDDVCKDKFNDRDGTTVLDNETQDLIMKDINFIKINNDRCLEDSVIQDSPEDNRKDLSKIRQRMAIKNKEIEIFQLQNEKSDENLLSRDKNDAENRGNLDTDTDMTVFDPKLCSTQLANPPSTSSKVLRMRKSLIGKDKTDLRDKNGGSNDSNVIDETIFEEENIVPASNNSDRLSQRKSNSEKIVKKKKLSLKKMFNVHRNSDGSDNDKDNSRSNKEIDKPVYVSSSEELEIKEVSPLRKKVALANFDVLPRKKNSSPKYAYKGSPVRNKAERALLNGWSCINCQEYYEAIGLSEEELQKRKNKCSRHRSKFNEKKVTQEDYWDPDFSSSFHSTMWTDD